MYEMLGNLTQVGEVSGSGLGDCNGDWTRGLQGGSSYHMTEKEALIDHTQTTKFLASYSFAAVVPCQFQLSVPCNARLTFVLVMSKPLNQSQILWLNSVRDQ